MFLGQCIPSITLHQVFVYRLALCISVLLEASQNMPGSRPNIARRAAWTLDFVYDSTPKSFFDRGFQGRCHSLQFSHGEYQPNDTPSSASPLHMSRSTFLCTARKWDMGLPALHVLSWSYPPLFWSECQILSVHRTWEGIGYSQESPLLSHLLVIMFLPRKIQMLVTTNLCMFDIDVTQHR